MCKYLLTADDLVIKTEKKDWRKLTVKSWSQKLSNIASFGLRVCQNHGKLFFFCFCFFSYIFLRVIQGQIPTLFKTILDHISTVSLVQSFMFVKVSRVLDV